MRQSALLMMNAAVMSGRKFTTIALSLVTTRLIFQELGSVDLGIFMTIGATSGLLMILSNALTDSAMRYMAIDAGAQDTPGFCRTFNTTLGVLVVIGAAVLLLGGALAWPVASFLEMPEDRVGAARVVFFTTCAVLATNTIATAARGAALASQKHFLLALNDVSKSATKLIAAFALVFSPGDKLILWASAILLIELLLTAFLMIAVSRKVDGAVVRPSMFDRKRVSEILGFGGWQLLGAVSWRIRSLGAQLLLNKTFGPTANSAYGLATQFGSFQNAATGSVRRAVNPAVISQHGGKNEDTVRKIVLSASRLVPLFGAMVSVPIIFETEAVLGLWLGAERLSTVPDIVPLARMIAIWMTVETLASPFIAAIQALGKIGKFMVITSLIEGSALIGAIVAVLAFGAPPVAVPVSALAGVVCNGVFRLMFVAPKIGLSRARWIRETVLPVFAAVLPGVGAGFAVIVTMEPSLSRLAVSVALIGTTLAFSSWFIGAKESDRVHFRRMGRKIAKKIPFVKKFVKAPEPPEVREAGDPAAPGKTTDP
ncbi:MAG: hypothetical protein AAF235_02365 [Planctomycetota bacterium]